jgi:hypothetical protein
MSESLKPYGFLQEDFHSEVLDYLFELITYREPKRKLVLYNEVDRYQNLDIYKKKYTNLTTLGLDHFVPDLVNKACEKMFIISFDNVFHLHFLLHYKRDLVFMVHSSEHVCKLKKYNLSYFSLTHMLSNTFTIPFLKQKNVIDNFSDSSELNSYNIDKNEENLNKIKKLQKDNNLEILMTVGYFLKTNKDINLVENLLKTRKYILMIYTNEITFELTEIVNKYGNYVFVSLKMPTLQILSDIKNFDIKYLLFTPTKDSDFFKSLWSGTIQFAFDYDLHLVIHEDLANMYKINNRGLVTYNNVDDIINKIQNKSVLDYIGDYQNIRNSVFHRNNIIFDVMFNKMKTLSIGDFKIEFSENTDIMYESSYYNHIINSLSIPQDTFYNKVVLDINTNTCLLNLIFMLLEKNCKVISFIKDINIAKYHKDIFIYNNLNDRITFFNAEIAAQSSKRDDIDLFKIDDLKYNNLCLIHLDSNNFDNIIQGAEKTILYNKPIIFVRCYNNYNTTFLQNLGYKMKTFDSDKSKIEYQVDIYQISSVQNSLNQNSLNQNRSRSDSDQIQIKLN